MPAPLDPATVQAAIDMYLDGRSWDEITAATGASKPGIQKHLSRRGIPTRPPRVPDELPGLADEYDGGASANEIAQRRGISRGAVENRLRAAGVELRSRGDATRTFHARRRDGSA